MGLLGFFNKRKNNGKKNDVMTPEKAQFTVLQKLHGAFSTPNDIKDNKISIPKWNVEITPYVNKIEKNAAFLVFSVSSPNWEKTMIESCAGMGKDSETAIGMAISSFLFAFMDGIRKMNEKEDAKPLTTVFNGKEHRWNVYISSIVGMGTGKRENNTENSTLFYWDLLKDDLIKRLGDQKVCAVKIYAAKNGSNITTECRIDDEVSRRLSKRIADGIRNWKTDGFASEKQYIFIEQADETFIPQVYKKAESNAEFKAKVKTCMEMYLNATDEEKFRALPDEMIKAIGDTTLALECYCLLPEVLAMQEMDGIVDFEEYFDLYIGDKKPIKVYGHQFSDLYPMKRAAYSLLSEHAFGDKTDEVFNRVVGSSSIYNTVLKAKNDGSDIKDLKMTAVAMTTTDEFEIR